MPDDSASVDLLDYGPPTETFLEDVVIGLSRGAKRLPSKYFYDHRGSKLFEQICQLDEYPVTRSELAIMRRFADEMAAQIGPGVMLVEYGSGSSVKTRLLLDHLEDPIAYVPVDISRRHLQLTAERLSAAYPDVQVLPVCADFTSKFDLPVADPAETHKAVYFPGSTIGNFQAEAAVEFLRGVARLCGRGGGLLIGIDLKKDVAEMEAAYNDRQGVTAEFNRNLLHRINRELDGDFQPEQFRHEAVYNDDFDRIEMHLVSEQDQEVSVGEHTFEFSEGESICTEYSHKYSIQEFAALAASTGLTLRRHWCDADRSFAVLHLAVIDEQTTV
ncbi:MAG: L-histidine N(alpha)-methyltransferase [Planctomycetota bacterium]|nr:MAG: L-histidine N(alpha)-methyltransferase [Planctomycetota bacterium]REJ95917.1 MAG: L-histidine N(alpha)-methyltransferase [Planctomycetota bacterium]REK18089.1 MAG: L-histidine N(alpha)-methyltransferase [Planctomycetota bacterium]REK37966.1 MAG: L-histidine N(alpha)-methyltransferase [Planctomycetota bacterium]